MGHGGRDHLESVRPAWLGESGPDRNEYHSLASHHAGCWLRSPDHQITRSPDFRRVSVVGVPDDKMRSLSCRPRSRFCVPGTTPPIITSPSLSLSLRFY